MTERPRSLVADACYLTGGAAMVASAFVHWVSRGPGSGLRGHRLVDAVVALGNNVPALSGGRLTVVWYLVPALGAAAWIVCGITGARSTAARAVGIAALLVTLLALVSFARHGRHRATGLGPQARHGRRCPLMYCRMVATAASVAARDDPIGQNDGSGP